MRAGCRRFLILIVLAAFLAAQGVQLSHRVGHAAEDVARETAEACPHGTPAAHFCSVGHADDHGSDCVLCTTAVVRSAVPVLYAVSPVAAGLVSVAAVSTALPRMAPGAVSPAPRGPPA